MINKSGFTLIEISIVLVILGLIVGGILMGQTLIESAEIRKVIKQREEFETGATSFRLKYNCLPGDCREAFTLGLASAVNGSGTYGQAGNGNGVIGDAADTYEATAFWYHLSEAKMIGWSHPTGLIPLPTETCTLVTPCLARQYTSFSGERAGWWVHSTYSGVFITNNTLPVGAGNYLWIAGSTGQGAVEGAAVFSQLEAYRLDTKIDDGRPLNGIVLAAGDVPDAVYGPTNATIGITDSDNACIVNVLPPQEYSIYSLVADGTSMCSLLIKASF
ncbi:MAG: type II secretion system protein [Alphaproteobacteria bacterium]